MITADLDSALKAKILDAFLDPNKLLGDSSIDDFDFREQLAMALAITKE